MLSVRWATLFFFTILANYAPWRSRVFVATARVRKGLFFPPEQLTQVDLLFLAGGGQAHGASTHHTPRAMTTQQRPPHRRPGPVTSGPKDPGRFLSPCSKCTSGSHLTPVRPNFHFRGRCGFQIIYHFPKCFHMCAAFPSARGPCLRPTFSKCIKIQFAPKKFRH